MLKNAFNFIQEYYDYIDIMNKYLEVITEKYTDYKIRENAEVYR